MGRGDVAATTIPNDRTLVISKPIWAAPVECQTMPRKKDYERKGGELEEIEGLSGRLTADLQKRVHLIKSCAVRAAERKFSLVLVLRVP